jgi:hypothetical protein
MKSRRQLGGFFKIFITANNITRPPLFGLFFVAQVTADSRQQTTAVLFFMF